MLPNTYTLETCHTAAGTVVAIDVMRAFTTAAYAFAAGAERILLAGEVEQALALRERFPGSLIMGEAGGRPVEEFDLWNSPYEIQRTDLSGKTIIQRTSAGTQGVVRSVGASYLLASSFVVAEATLRLIRRKGIEPVGFVATGLRTAYSGDEDLALAEYLHARLSGEPVDPAPYLERVSGIDLNTLSDDPEMVARFALDQPLCAELDRFSFGLEVQRQDGLLILNAVETNA